MRGEKYNRFTFTAIENKEPNSLLFMLKFKYSRLYLKFFTKKRGYLLFIAENMYFCRPFFGHGMHFYYEKRWL